MKKMLLLAILLVGLSACTTEVVVRQDGQVQNAISVQGSSEFEIAPDMAKIRFSIQTMSSNAQDAQLRNRELGASVMSALLGAGVRKSDIETADYRVEKVVEWDHETQRNVDKGFRAVNTFVVSTTELERVGVLLDVGVQAGANNVESVNFELSDAKQREVKTEALKLATENARDKASALADGAGIRLGKVLSLSENSYVVMPYSRYDTMAVKAEMGGAPQTEISPQSVQVSAQVSVSYEIA